MQACVQMVRLGGSGRAARSSLFCMNRRLRGCESEAAASIFAR